MIKRDFLQFKLTDDPASVDLDTVCDLLKDTYWASERTREMIKCMEPILKTPVD